MYYRFGKVFHFLSALLFIFVFLYTYSALPDFVSYQFDMEANMVDGVTKNTFFYTGIILFVVLNVAMIVPAKLVENQSTPTIKRLFPIGEEFRDHMMTWIYSFAGIINVSLSILCLFVHSINNQNEIESSSFNFFFYLVPIFFVVWILGLFWILLQRFKAVQTNRLS